MTLAENKIGTKVTISAAAAASSSMLSTESPPFSPKGIRRLTPSTSPGPPSSRLQSLVNSPIRNSFATAREGTGATAAYTNAIRTASITSSNGIVGSAAAAEMHSNALPRHTFTGPDGENLEIRNVWLENVEEEMALIRELIETHPYVAMDTEFPGVVARPVSETFSTDYHYKSLKCNVDLLKIIQLGLSFAEYKDGTFVFAKGCPCWQFNFKFNLDDDMFAQDSIDLLVKSGISFADHATRGIDPLHFGELLMVSGLVLDERVKWVTYHSGYDYGYLLKILTTIDLPENEKSFFETLRLYFPSIYDIKYMTSLCDGHFGGLQKLADDLKCPRIGPEHQAGSDSLLTMTTYFALAKQKFTNKSTGIIDDAKFRNELFGYGVNHTVHKNRIHAQSSHSSSNSNVSILTTNTDKNN